MGSRSRFVWNENARSGAGSFGKPFLTDLPALDREEANLFPIGTSYLAKNKNLNEGRYSLTLNAIRFVLKNWSFWWDRTSKSGKNEPVMKIFEIWTSNLLPIIDDAEFLFGFCVFGIIRTFLFFLSDVTMQRQVNGTQISHFIP